MISIDLNADVGEGMPGDAHILSVVSSCNIACGGHAGDRDSMATTLQLAAQHGVCAGAHPSYPDREHFGREIIKFINNELETIVFEQINNLETLSRMTGQPLTHVKPHGALYHQAAADGDTAQAVVGAVLRLAQALAIVGPPTGALRAATAAAGLRYISEGFADRRYTPDGQLVGRGQSGAVLTDPSVATRQAVQLATTGEVTTECGTTRLEVETLCLHGDTPGAQNIARAVRAGLLDAGVTIQAVQ